MPGHLHEAFVAVLRQPECALELARQVGVPDHPTFAWHDVDGEFPDPAGKGRLFHADLALVAFSSAERGGEALAGLIFEPQLRIDPGKDISWPVYWVTLRTRHVCPVWLIVVSPVDTVVQWAATQRFRGEPQVPHVIGRAHVQPVLDVDRALANPAWAALTAALHARGPHARASAETLIQACASLPAEPRQCYLRLVFAGLEKNIMNAIKPSISEALKWELTDYEREGGWFQNGLAEGEAKGLAEGEAKGLAEGEAKGEATGVIKGRREALLMAIEARGLALSEAQRATVEACTDGPQLERWLRRLFQVDTADALLAEPH